MRASVLALMASTSSPSSAVLSSAPAASISALVARVDLVAHVAQRLLGGVDRFSALFLTSASSRALLVLLGVRLGVLHHVLDVLLAEAAARR